MAQSSKVLAALSEGLGLVSSTWQLTPISNSSPRVLSALFCPGEWCTDIHAGKHPNYKRKKIQVWQFEFILVLLPQDEKQRQKNPLEASGAASLEYTVWET